MAVTRVTQGIVADRVLQNINSNISELLRLQDQLSTGRRINRPSDDPLDARRAINARTAINVNEQFLDNIESIQPQLLESTNAIETALDIVQRVRELTLQGANGTNAPEQLELIAIEINQLLENVVEQANAETNGRFLFGGTRTGAPAYSVTRDGVTGDITAVTFEGNEEAIEIDVADNARVRINEPGTAPFQSQIDVFELLINIRDELNATDQTTLRNVRLGELDQAQEQLLTSLAKIGSLQNRLERLTFNLDDSIVQLEKLFSDSIDVDFAELIVNLNQQENAYQAALNAGARVIVPSLLDFVV